MRWLVDGYNVIRRSAALSSREKASLEEGRRALCELLGAAARLSGDTFTVVFDGAGGGGRGSGPAGVAVVFSSARESADRVLAGLARAGGAVVSNDREVRRSAERAGATPVGADDFLAEIERALAMGSGDAEGESEEDDRPKGPRKGNPYRLPKKARAARRALGRLGSPRRPLP